MSRVLFGNKVLREPGAASMLQIGVAPSVNPNGTNRVAVLGPSDGGIPGTVYTFNSYLDARTVLRGGDALNAISHVFNPSPIYGGASQVTFVRTSQPTTSQVSLKDAATLVGVALTSVDSGPWTAGIQVTVAAGVIAATSRILTVKVPSPTIEHGADGVLTNPSSTTQFDAPSALFLTNGARVGDAISLGGQTNPNAAIFTIKTIVSETTVILNETANPTTGSSLTWSHFAYDRVQVSPEIPPVAGTVNINANMVSWINTFCGDVLVAALSNSAAAIIAVTTGPNNMTGGTDSTMINQDVTAALALIQTVPVSHITVARACGTGSGELDFSGLLRGHLLTAAETPALGYIGAAANKTDALAMAYAATLNSGRIVYLSDTATGPSITGLGTQTLPGYLLAAKAAGLAAGLPPEMPLTRKPVSILSLVGTPRTKAQREAMLAAGIFILFQPSGSTAFVVDQGVTTLQANNTVWDTTSAMSSEISLMRITDTLLNDLQTSAAATFVGSTATLTLPVIQHFVQSYLESKVGSLLEGYGTVTITQVQEVWNVTMGIIPNYPVDQILITGNVIA